MDQPSKDFSNNKYGHNGSIPSCGGELLSVQVAGSIPGACAINGADTSFVYGNGKAEKQDYHQRSVPVRYRECLKNHAASIGSHAVDGCGEFMPRGAEGTEDAMKCMACGCHRNFHRREAGGEEALPPPPGLYTPYGRNVLSAPYGVNNLLVSVAASGTPIEQLEGGDGQRRGGLVAKKRFRTKFTVGQKDKMLGFAERIGWRIQKQDEAAVQRFCEEVGVRRHVLKVWMHNNKNSSARKS